MPRATCRASSLPRPASTRLEASTGANGAEANWWTDGVGGQGRQLVDGGLVAGVCRTPTVWALASMVTGTAGWWSTAATVSTTASTAAAVGGARAAAGSGQQLAGGRGRRRPPRWCWMGSTTAKRSFWVSAGASV